MPWPLIISVSVAILVSLIVLLVEANRTEWAAALADDSLRDKERKRRAKRLNERLKLASSFASGLGVAFFATSVLTPLAQGRALSRYEALLGAGIALILHIQGQLALHLWKSEE